MPSRKARAIIAEEAPSFCRPMVEKKSKSRMHVLTEGVAVVLAGLGNLVAHIGALARLMQPEWVREWRDGEPWQR